MFETVDRKYYNHIRLGAIVFATVVVLFLLVDYLAFSSKEKGVEAALNPADLQVVQFTGDTLEISIPMIVKNNLALAITPGKFDVKFGGKSVIPDKADFSIGAGESDTINIPLLFLFKGKDSLHQPLPLEISLKTGIFYRSWDVSYSGKISPESILGKIMSETGKAFADGSRHISGKFKETGGNVKSTITVKNPFPYPVTVSFDGKPILNTGSKKGVSASSTPEPVVVAPGKSEEIVLVFAHKPENKSPDKGKEKKQTKGYQIGGNLIIKVLDMQEKRSKMITLEEGN